MTVMTFTAPATADVVMSSPPTVTTVPGQSSALSGSTMVLADDAVFRYIGAGDFHYGSTYPKTVLYAPYSRYPYTRDMPKTFGIEFAHTGSAFEIVAYYQNEYTSYRVWVDGVRVTIMPQDHIPGVNTGYSFMIRVSFAMSATRTIRIDTGYFAFRGVNIASGDTLVAS